MVPVTVWSRVLLLCASLAVTACTHATVTEQSTAPGATGASTAQGVQRCNVGEAFARTELFFGRSRPGGTMVTDAEWQGFLDQEITPRFPDGLTVLLGRGHFRGQSGVISREDAVLVIVLYPVQTPESSRRIEDIREAYTRTFQQQSVLRADAITCASF